MRYPLTNRYILAFHEIEEQFKAAVEEDKTIIIVDGVKTTAARLDRYKALQKHGSNYHQYKDNKGES